MKLGRDVAAFLLALLLVVAASAVGAGQPPVAVAGLLQLPGGLQQPVPLQGQWGFAWQRFVAPDWEQLPASAFASVPSSWNDQDADGKPPGENGWGSYVLQVDCPRGESLAVEALGQRTASRLFINGTLVAAHGEPGRTAAETRAAVHNRVPITREFACPLRITLHVSNFAHRAGGFVRPLVAGPADLLEKQRESRIVYAAALLTAYLVTGIAGLIFFAARPRQRLTLVFGLFCVAMAVYTDMISQRLFLRLLPQQVSWTAYMQVEYLAWIAAMALFVLTLRGLFPQEIDRRVLQAVLALLGIAAVAVVVLPPGIYSFMVLPGQSIAVVVAAYIAAGMVRASLRGRIDARVLLAGMLAVVLSLAIDLLLIDSVRPDQKFAPAGFALFLLSPAAIIARRMTRALNAEERSRTLEENARLREEVERISRHDLKTPLNSILGASRLLHEDRRLAGEQRELVDVLQRAGLRMLEMVNLSLGLFKMETGSYDFRPQAVDLREVVSRVLVDLHSYAEASGVTLHRQGSHPGPVYARAEELLCYSILANLVKNAVEATAPGGQVDVSLRAGEPLAVSVHNTGEVAPEIAARFFEKYVTAKSGGTGLGTYSARLMARAQHGDLVLRTSAAEGTTLTLTLPALKGEAPMPLATSAAEVVPAAWLADLPARDVLLVDDDEFTRLVTRRLLPDPPFSVETAANGQAAKAAMARRWPDYLLVDMEMPLMGGVETVRWLREQEAAHGRPRCGVLMMSGNDDDASASRALAAGADRFLVKPVSRERLLAALHELEGGGSEAARGIRLPPLPAAPAPEGEGVVCIDPEWAEVFPEFLRLQQKTVDDMAQALAADNREELHFLAHRAHGGLAAMGLAWASRQARAVELKAHEAPPHELEPKLDALRAHLGSVRVVAR